MAALAASMVGCSSDRSATESTTTVRAADSDGYRAEIRRTTDGVPHITASDLGSVVFGQGWASGEDYSCTLADQILKVTSTRAKWLGPGEGDENVDSDFAWKALRLEEIATKEWTEVDSRVRDLMDAFTAGWNAHLARVGADGVKGWCAGAAWLQPITPFQLFTYAKSIALAASGAQLARFVGKVQPPSTGDGAGAPSSTSAKPAALHSGGAADSPASGIGGGEPSGSGLASNAWALGSERSSGGGGMLMANPHFPWEGPLRFWEVQLTVPGQLNIYGAMLTGLPAVGIGFNEHIAWSHTVSAGNRFTAYRLTLAPGDPTSYVKDAKPVAMRHRDVTIEVAGAAPVTRTLWWSEYGPILDFPGVGWSRTSTLTFRDANSTNDELFDQFLAMDRATSMAEFKKAHRRYQGIPLFNTIAASSDGQAWYADTSATPNLSPAAEAAFKDRLKSDPLTKTAYDNGAVLLDGSTSRDDWVDEKGARDPGLVPYSRMPQITRRDYVFNANDSYWLANGKKLLTGDYSILHGAQDTERSARTRENLAVLSDVGKSSPAGADGRFTLDELGSAALRNGGFLSRELRSEVVERCRKVTTVDLAPRPAAVGQIALPGGSVDLTKACQVLDEWNGRYDVDSRGAALFREFLGQFDRDAVWADPFDPDHPLTTPKGLVAAPTDGSPDPVLQALATAAQTLAAAGFELSVPLGEVQIDGRGSKLAVPGGTNTEGATNIVTWNPGLNKAAQGEGAPVPPERLSTATGLTSSGWLVDYGTSFLMVVDFTRGGPKARSILTYGETEDRDDPRFTSQTRRFAEKRWKDVAFTPAQIAAQAVGKAYTVGAPRR
ncbi:MAG: penicillin acylase family protein [Microthrixaceae bacterium]